MKRSTLIAASVLLTMAVAWAAFGQAGGGGGRGKGGGRGGMMGPAMQKNVADLAEQVNKLKALVDQGTKAMEGKTFADLSDDDRAKMKERGTEQQKLLAAIQQGVDKLRIAQVAREHNEAIKGLQELQASAKKENAKETAAEVQKMIDQNNKLFEEKITALGYTMEQMQRMGQGRRGGGGQ